MYIYRDKEKWRGNDSEVNKRYKQTLGSCKAGRCGNTLVSMEEVATSVSVDNLSEE